MIQPLEYIAKIPFDWLEHCYNRKPTYSTSVSADEVNRIFAMLAHIDTRLSGLEEKTPEPKKISKKKVESPEVAADVDMQV